MKKLIYLLCSILLFVAAGQAQNITAAEYFIDTDPGSGNGTPLTITTPGNSVPFAANISTGSLANGFHLFAIRTKDENGKWGFIEQRGFYINTTLPDAGSIISSEYFIDTDPGRSNGNPITVTSGTHVPVTVIIPLTSLATGFHLLAIRTKNADGNWGLFEQRGFYINPVAFDMPVITAAEYFFDTDPGVGNGTTLTINTPGTTVSQNCILTVPITASQGQHLAVLRVKDLTGHWGLFDFGNITVSGVLPLSLIHFSGQVQYQYVLLRWQTENEINISHFEIEQSNDGIIFVKINTKTANNTSGRNEYSLTDKSVWSTSARFYRLKMIDIDGRFRYSNIIKLTHDSNNPLTIFPNPATDVITISGLDGKGEIEIWSADGKLLQRENVNAQTQLLNLKKLIDGTYLLRYNNGENIFVHRLLIQH
jgi:hypothetical protein